MKTHNWFIRRALVAGAVAGVATAAIVEILGEPAVRKALAIEDARPTIGHSAEMFSRSTQVIGGAAAAVLYGLIIGMLFCGAFLVVRHRLRINDDFRRVTAVAAAGFVATVLIPLLKYPANPPAVGDPDTITKRTASYLLLLAWGLAVVTIVWLVHQRLADRALSIGIRSGACISFGIALVTLAYLILPNASAVPSDMPAGLIWRFRLVSLAGLTTTWSTLGLVMGWLCDRPANEPAPFFKLRSKRAAS